jgi:hypothetical protein
MDRLWLLLSTSSSDSGYPSHHISTYPSIFTQSLSPCLSLFIDIIAPIICYSGEMILECRNPFLSKSTMQSFFRACQPILRTDLSHLPVFRHSTRVPFSFVQGQYMSSKLEMQPTKKQKMTKVCLPIVSSIVNLNTTGYRLLEHTMGHSIAMKHSLCSS